MTSSEQTTATADYPAGTLHVYTESKAGFPIHWFKKPGEPWAAENCNTPTADGNPITGPGLYDWAAGPGAQYSVHAD